MLAHFICESFSHSLISMIFIIIIIAIFLLRVFFDRLPPNVFQCDWCPCLYYYFYLVYPPSLGWVLMAGLWILLATGVFPSYRGWVAGQP